MKLVEKDLGMFGQVFNGEDRKKPVENPERNTPEEAKVVADINNHLAFKTEPLPKETASIIKHLLKTKQYKDFIVKPDTRIVYRGMSISEEDLISFGQKLNQTIDTKNQRVGSFDLPGINFIFTPQEGRACSSWTKESDVAFDFGSYNQFDATGTEAKKKYGLILGAQTAKNQYKFWDLQKWYEEIDSSLHDEQEVVGIGKISIQWVKWFRN